MTWRLWLALVLSLELCNYVNAATTCIAEMLMCTRQMTNSFTTADNKTKLCGVMDMYMDCIEFSCNISLTRCDIAKARSVLTDMLTDYGIQCDVYSPRKDESCIWSSTASSTPSACGVWMAFCLLCMLAVR